MPRVAVLCCVWWARLFIALPMWGSEQCASGVRVRAYVYAAAQGGRAGVADFNRQHLAQHRVVVDSRLAVTQSPSACGCLWGAAACAELGCVGCASVCGHLCVIVREQSQSCDVQQQAAGACPSVPPLSLLVVMRLFVRFDTWQPSIQSSFLFARTLQHYMHTRVWSVRASTLSLCGQ